MYQSAWVVVILPPSGQKLLNDVFSCILMNEYVYMYTTVWVVIRILEYPSYVWLM